MSGVVSLPDRLRYGSRARGYVALVELDGEVAIQQQGATYLSAAELASALAGELQGSGAGTVEISVRVR